MKKLLLIRHAKSSWDHPGLSDHDRPLNKRGLRDAPRMAKYLESVGVEPDLIVSSTAVRARETARIVGSGLGVTQSEIFLTDNLYHASARAILGLASQLDEKAGTAMLFGHNPGMHDAAEQLARQGRIDYFPTLAVARFEIPVTYWGEIDPGVGELVELVTPKTLPSD